MDILDATIISSNFWPTIQVCWTILLLVLIVRKDMMAYLVVLTLLGGISKMRGEGIITVALHSHIFSLPSLHEVPVYCILMKNENGKHHVAYTHICGPL
jgi:hypothetical protein